VLRIAHVISTPTGFGGAEQTLAQLVAFGGGEGWAQTVLNPFALDPSDPRTREQYEPAAYEGRRCTSLRDFPALRRWLGRRLNSLSPDVVHAHLFHASVLVASIRQPTGARLVLSHQHGDHFRAIGAPGLELLDRIAGRRFDRVVGCSAYVERHLIEHYRYPPRRVSVVRNGWGGAPMPHVDAAEPPTVLCVAHLRTQKNHRMLIDAIARVREHVPDVRLQLVGDGPERGALEARARGLALNGTVEFCGDIADVWPVLARARVFALASDYEPLGIAALEAMAAGVPVVATDVGGLPEIVQDGLTGFLVPAHDTAALAERIERLISDSTLASSFGEHGRRLAEDHRAQRTVEGYAQVYSDLLRGAGG